MSLKQSTVLTCFLVLKNISQHCTITASCHSSVSWPHLVDIPHVPAHVAGAVELPLTHVALQLWSAVVCPHVVGDVRAPAEPGDFKDIHSVKIVLNSPAVAGGNFARKALALAMDKVNVLLQGALALELGLAVNLWALEHLHPRLLGFGLFLLAQFPRGVRRVFILHHLNLPVSVLLAVLACVNPEADL